MTENTTMPFSTETLAAAAEQLRAGLSALAETDHLRDIQTGRDEVYARYSPLFSPAHLPQLTADEFASFLDFKNNRHWSGIDQHVALVVGDLPALREALIGLLDQNRPLAEAYDAARGVKGFGKARITAFMHVAAPNDYGVWNSKSEEGLRKLGIFPKLSAKATEGQYYEAVNDTLVWLATNLEIDLWTLDTLWEWLFMKRPDGALAPPFDAIFADRAQAEWAFDLFRDAVEKLGGGPDDPRFALTLRRGEGRMRLNMGNSMVLDIGDRGRTLHMTALIEEMERHFPFERWAAFRGESDKFAAFTIPPDEMRHWSTRLKGTYEQSMAEFGKVFSRWEKSNLLGSRNSSLYAALFDTAKRDALMTNGLLPDVPRYWRITLPADLRDDLSDGRGSYNFWADCLAHGVAAISFDDQPNDPQIARFASIRPGDRVVAFLRNKTIGGIGTVTSPLDERVAEQQPPDQDFFHGGMWRRIGVDWEAQTIRVADLPQATQNKFGTKTVLELTAADFAEVEKLMKVTPIEPPSGPSIAREFHGFTMDAFTFLQDLRANNSKMWMEKNRERWHNSVLEPMRALFSDLGPSMSSVFDPYLIPDTLEVRPTTQRTLAKIYKNWAATPDSPYYDYYWGAFYRSGLSRQTDAQLFFTLQPNESRFGFYLGESAAQIRKQYRRRVLDDLEGFVGLVSSLGITKDFEFVIRHEDGEREVVAIKSADDMRRWVESNDPDLLLPLFPEATVRLGPGLVDTVYDAFRRVFPIYLWAVAEDHLAAVERYLAAEFPDDDEIIDVEPPPTPYSMVEFRAHTYLPEDDAEELLHALRQKRQLIFYGPPGTGKTYVADKLARLLIGLAEPPPERLETIQFHPAYGYEEFIEGIRPKSIERDGATVVDYPVRPGAFVRFCRGAAQMGDAPCVFIIDEINRGNVPRIFGELMLLLEYRDKSALLPYSGDRFRIPPNVYVIGTMNTADRSIALVDFALRRRFHFFEFAADPDLFDRWLAAQPTALPWLRNLYRRLTAEAIDDPAYRIGPSAFMVEDMTTADVARVWRRSVIPYLREYYFDQPERAGMWEWDKELLRSIRGEDGVSGQ